MLYMCELELLEVAISRPFLFTNTMESPKCAELGSSVYFSYSKLCMQYGGGGGGVPPSSHRDQISPPWP